MKEMNVTAIWLQQGEGPATPFMMPDAAANRRSTANLVRKAGWGVMTLFWIVQFGELTFLSFLQDPQHAWSYFGPQIALVIVGMLLTAALLEVIIMALARPLAQRLAAVLIGTLVACGALIAANYYIIFILLPVDYQFNRTEFVYQAFAWSWFFLSVAGAILSASYILDVKDRENRLVELQGVAQAAQMRALRFQLNPHFLFNTLNSIAALIARGSNSTAEHMVESLSDFLRTSLELDPQDDIALAREVGLQKLYLGIEKLRFPKKLIVESHIPHELAKAMVPSLITQPLVENAVKYAVARGVRPVTISISASTVGGRLRICVQDDGCTIHFPKVASTGLGLQNVASRLSMRFGDDQNMTVGARPEGGYAASIEFPLQFGP